MDEEDGLGTPGDTGTGTPGDYGTRTPGDTGTGTPGGYWNRNSRRILEQELQKDTGTGTPKGSETEVLRYWNTNQRILDQEPENTRLGTREY